jgi:hypothetical protein
MRATREDSGWKTDEPRPINAAARRRSGKEQHAGAGEGHAGDQRIGHRPAVGDEADDRLEQRSGGVEGEGDEADLGVGQREGFAQNRVERRQQRLDGVVEEMREADREEDCVNGDFRPAGGKILGLGSRRAHVISRSVSGSKGAAGSAAHPRLSGNLAAERGSPNYAP